MTWKFNNFFVVFLQKLLLILKTINSFQVVKIPETSSETFDSLVQFGKAMGKTTVECKVWCRLLLLTLYYSSS